MYCPTCGQQQLNDEIRFCSRCGLLLSDIAEVVANKGLSPYKKSKLSSKKALLKKRGVKQGLKIWLIGLLFILPLVTIIHALTGTEPFMSAITLVVSFFGGLLRIIYALVFEEESVISEQNQLGGNTNQNALPPQQSIPVNDYMPPKTGSWMTTNDLARPSSVTEHTTNILSKKE